MAKQNAAKTANPVPSASVQAAAPAQGAAAKTAAAGNGRRKKIYPT